MNMECFLSCSNENCDFLVTFSHFHFIFLGGGGIVMTSQNDEVVDVK